MSGIPEVMRTFQLIDFSYFVDAATENNRPHLPGRNHSVIGDAASDSVWSLQSRFALISALICYQQIQTVHRAVSKDRPQ